jgi:hypothetical protein
VADQQDVPIPPEVMTVKSWPLPNAADAAWDELVSLRARAVDLGIEVDDSWPIIRLREEIAKVAGDNG